MKVSLDDKLSDHQKAINLRARFPLSQRSIIRRSWRWIGSYLIALFLITIANPTAESTDSTSAINFYEALSMYVIFGGLTIVVIKLIYQKIFHLVYYYGIEDDHLVISCNVLLKHRASFPLAVITDVHLDRKIMDFLFGLYDLRIATPHLASAKFAKIRGLSRKNAILLQDYLTSVIETFHPQVNNTKIQVQDDISNSS